MRKIFQDRKLLEALNSDAFVKQGIVTETPAQDLGFVMDFSDQDMVNRINANRDLLRQMFPDFADVQIIVKEVEEAGEMVVKGFIRGIDSEQASIITGEDRFAQFLGFKDAADMRRTAEHFLPAGNIQKATKQVMDAIDKGIGDAGSLGLSDAGEFGALEFFTDPKNLDSLRAYKNLLQEQGLLPPGLGDDLDSLKLFQQFLQDIIDEGTRAAHELQPMSDAILEIAEAAKKSNHNICRLY